MLLKVIKIIIFTGERESQTAFAVKFTEKPDKSYAF
jgi:hypothetical protein